MNTTANLKLMSETAPEPFSIKRDIPSAQGAASNVENLSKVETLLPQRFSYRNLMLFFIGPFFVAGLAAWYVVNHGFQLGEAVSFLVMYVLTMLSITSGYHRHFSHRTHQAHPIIQFAHAFFGAATMQNSILVWCSDHRYHHQYVDRDGDPYNIKKGFFWAHMGWLLYNPAVERHYKNCADLKANKIVMLQHNYYVLFMAVSGLLLPTLIGAAFGRPFAGFLWGGLVRIVVTNQVTFMINSVAHYFGKQDYSLKGTAKTNIPLAFLAFGEGYHNFHHAYGGDYRLGPNWYDWDPGKWFIVGMSKLGLTWDLRKTVDLRELKLAERHQTS